jgi:hypothetical protein
MAHCRSNIACTELRLPSRSLQEHHEHTCRGAGHIRTEIVLDEREPKIDAR